MDKKEFEVQRALGNIEKYRVKVKIPIKLTVSIEQVVNAVNEEDAIEQLKIIHNIIPDDELLRVVVKEAQDHNYRIRDEKFDDSIKWEYKTQAVNGPKDSLSPLKPMCGSDG